MCNYLSFFIFKLNNTILKLINRELYDINLEKINLGLIIGLYFIFYFTFFAIVYYKLTRIPHHFFRKINVILLSII